MNDGDLPDDAHIVHYARPTTVREDGRVDGSAFRLRSDDAGLSANWLECLAGLAKAQQLNEVRRLSRIEMRPSGRLAELNVGATKLHVREQLPSLRFVHAPLPKEGPYEADPSHSEIVGLPSRDSLEAALIGDMIAECVSAVHPAIASQATA